MENTRRYLVNTGAEAEWVVPGRPAPTITWREVVSLREAVGELRRGRSFRIVDSRNGVDDVVVEAKDVLVVDGVSNSEVILESSTTDEIVAAIRDVLENA